MTVVEELCDELVPDVGGSLDRNRDVIVGRVGLVQKSGLLFIWPIVGLLVRPIVRRVVHKLIDKFEAMTGGEMLDYASRLKAERVPGSAPPEITLD